MCQTKDMNSLGSQDTRWIPSKSFRQPYLFLIVENKCYLLLPVYHNVFWLVLLSQTVHHPWYERILDESSELRNGPVRGNKISGWDVKVVSSLQVQALAIVYQVGAGLLFFRAEPTHPMWCFVHQALMASGEVMACDELHKPGKDVPWLLYEFSGLLCIGSAAGRKILACLLSFPWCHLAI